MKVEVPNPALKTKADLKENTKYWYLNNNGSVIHSFLHIRSVSDDYSEVVFKTGESPVFNRYLKNERFYESHIDALNAQYKNLRKMLVDNIKKRNELMQGKVLTINNQTKKAA